MVIYAGEPDEYFCFITPEAYSALSEWMEYRKNSGEDISGESFLIRDIWSSTEFDTFKNSTLGLVKYPNKLKSSGIKSLIERAMRSQGLARPLPEGIKRRAWKSGHGYRKFFKTQAEQVVRLYNELKENIFTIGQDISLKPKKVYIAFVRKTNFSSRFFILLILEWSPVV